MCKAQYKQNFLLVIWKKFDFRLQIRISLLIHIDFYTQIIKINIHSSHNRDAI